MKYTKMTFVFTPEIGARLHELRKRRSLYLRTLALLMDRQRPGSFNLLAKLERGDLKHPSINLIVDFLRACGAGFEDLLDLLKPQTSQRPVLTQKGDAAVAELLKSLPKAEQRAMLRWEKATTEKREEKAAAEPEKKKPRVETDRQRKFRIIWSFIHANWNEVFEQRLYETMRGLKNDVPRSQRKHACNHARRFFGILTRYYKHEARRKGALARVERRAKEDGFSDKVIAELRGAASRAHDELAGSGRLDWQPTQEEIIMRVGRAPKIEKAETRLEMDELGPGIEYSRTLGLVRAMVVQAVAARLDELKLAHYQGKEYYYYWIDRLIPIADEHGTDSPEWQAEVDATAPKLHDETIAREMAKLVAEIFNRWKVKLPPKPAAAPNPERNSHETHEAG